MLTVWNWINGNCSTEVDAIAIAIPAAVAGDVEKNVMFIRWTIIVFLFAIGFLSFGDLVRLLP